MQNSIYEAKRKKCAWIRIEPNSERDFQNIVKILAVCEPLYSVYCSPRDVQPREILVMDISKSEEELLSKMKPKTRYNIRLAEKRGVQVIVSKERKYRENFFSLVKTTADRAGIHPHPKEHYEKMFDVMENLGELYNAEYKGDIVAANALFFFKKSAIYLHGGSSNDHRSSMAPFLLHWRAIQDAKRKACMWYDFGGVDSGKDTMQSAKNSEREFRIPFCPSHIENRQDWSGITRFKQGFCTDTEPLRFPGTYDIVLHPAKYQLYRFLRRFRGK